MESATSEAVFSVIAGSAGSETGPIVRPYSPSQIRWTNAPKTNAPAPARRTWKSKGEAPLENMRVNKLWSSRGSASTVDWV
ncbi:hypothetical protein SAMN06296378_2937 [Salinibacterium xinjiangense]|uniref:Uncharacterized protein n=1 Tax=Salinibacterium xinjiangense TaxID=386302 RepID=A0A2C9A3T1_9MICO|nr:hypothetical protein SAMN06296378_2937 [Salinibacterium xinjiangense]